MRHSLLIEFPQTLVKLRKLLSHGLTNPEFAGKCRHSAASRTQVPTSLAASVTIPAEYPSLAIRSQLAGIVFEELLTSPVKTHVDHAPTHSDTTTSRATVLMSTVALCILYCGS